MTWKNKIEQLASLLEKIPHPQSFDRDKGVYQPYFVLEIRPANWEIIPFAEYTRLDGVAGKEIRLNYQVLESQKVNINQDELNLLSYLLSFNHYDTRRIFMYGQPVGFLLDWLRGSHIKIRKSDSKTLQPIDIAEENGNIALGIFKEMDQYVLRPIIVYPDHTVFIEGPVEVLTANPIYLMNKDTLYRVDSRMPAFFWINFFRIQEKILIPQDEIKEFISSFIYKIVPALDWKSLQEHLKVYQLPLNSTRIYLFERAGQFSVDVKFIYGSIEFPAYPTSEHSLASKENYLFIVKRDAELETAIRRLLHNHGLLYIQHHWQIDPQYQVLDWLRIMVPQLANQKNIQVLGEDQLKRHRLKRGKPELSVKIDSQSGWFNLSYQITLKGNSLKIPNIRELMLFNKKYVKIDENTHIYFGEDLSERLLNFLDLIGHNTAGGSDKFSFASFPLVEALVRLADKAKIDEGYKDWQSKYEDFSTIRSVQLSSEFNGTLRDYQRLGLDWLSFLQHFKLGGILADDMGLGKTIQVIALLLNLKQANKKHGPTLIVVPLTVLFNWENEIKRFAPSLKVLSYRGQKSEREEMTKNFTENDIVLLSYGILLQDHLILGKIKWNYIILDESQKIKNPQTKTYQAVENLQADQRLCLTGTPVENSVMDLWSQFNFLNPGMLGDLKQFELRFGRNGHEGTERHDLLKRIIHPFVLRRKKEDVLSELPDRTDITQLVDMTENQQRIYQKWVQYYRDNVFQHIEQEGITRNKLKILEALTYLRQLACHPAIFDSSVDLMDSGKVQLLEEMLEEILQEGHKVLVFSQFVRFLGLAKNLLINKEWLYEYLDGSTRHREKIIRNFQENPSVKIFLISLKAGGLGLNLTAADYVIHLDPWWNPAVEQQATDRAHRIGQKNRVFVYKYIVKNSVEEKIMELQQTKRKLSEGLITSEKNLVKELTMEDLELIFQI